MQTNGLQQETTVYNRPPGGRAESGSNIGRDIANQTSSFETRGPSKRREKAFRSHFTPEKAGTNRINASVGFSSPRRVERSTSRPEFDVVRGEAACTKYMQNLHAVKSCQNRLVKKCSGLKRRRAQGRSRSGS